MSCRCSAKARAKTSAGVVGTYVAGPSCRPFLHTARQVVHGNARQAQLRRRSRRRAPPPQRACPLRTVPHRPVLTQCPDRQLRTRGARPGYDPPLGRRLVLWRRAPPRRTSPVPCPARRPLTGHGTDARAPATHRPRPARPRAHDAPPRVPRGRAPSHRTRPCGHRGPRRARGRCRARRVRRGGHVVARGAARARADAPRCAPASRRRDALPRRGDAGAAGGGAGAVGARTAPQGV